MILLDLGSVEEAWEDATNKYTIIKQNDVKEWVRNNIRRKTNLKCKNSCVAPHAYYECSTGFF